MEAIVMGEKGWYKKALTALAAGGEIQMMADAAAASNLRRHLVAISDGGKGAGFWTVFNMIRYRRFHQILFSAFATGRGVSMRDASEGRLLVLIGDRIGSEKPGDGGFIVRRSRVPSHDQ